MSNWFMVLTLLFIIVSVAMILIILVQRAQGGGLAGAFGGAGGAGTETVFGGRVGDALTWATVVAFVLYLVFAIALNRVPITPVAPTAIPTEIGASPTAPEGDPGVTPVGVPAVDPTPDPVSPTETDPVEPSETDGEG